MNDQNLRALSSDEGREYGRLGGIASGEARRERKRLRTALEAALAGSYTVGEITSSGYAHVALGIMKRAIDGDVRAFEIIRDTIGEKPVERTEVAEISDETRAEVEALLFGDTA